jgi:2-oxo-3-hexenedioate decarboxylase
VPISDEQVERLAERILGAASAVSSIPPITRELPDFDLADAYRVSAEIVRRRIARGERPVGWKIGFTNRTIWDEYGVHAPIWGPMYDTTVQQAAPGVTPCPIGHLVEPRIEPEIALRIAREPHPEMDERELISCIDAVAHGFEVVQSVYPGWRFAAGDTVAAFALHGLMRYGVWVAVGPADRESWLARLADFEIVLSRNGVEVDKGIGTNVLDGPLSALRHFVRGHAEYGMGLAISPGHIITTGTVTRAFPVAPGERWSTRLSGLPLPAMDLAFVR